MSSLIQVTLKQDDTKAFLRDLDLLRLTGRQKQKIIAWTLQTIKRNSAKNIRAERSPDGIAWKKRSPNSEEEKQKKLLRRVLKYASVLADERGKGRIRYKNPLTGQIAFMQQEGFTEKFRLSFATDKNKKDQAGQLPATPRQAKTLRDLGYRKRVGKDSNGKTRYRLYTVQEIRKNLTRTWASMIIRRLRGGNAEGKSSWDITIPSRPFLDMRDEHNAEILKENILKFTSGKYK